MSIHITSYYGGVVNYTKDHIPSKMVVTESMMRDTFSCGEKKIYPMILGLVDHELVILIDKYHMVQNHIARDYTIPDVHLEYRSI